jgi:mono/diheme cytochrome c family protein
MIVRLAQASLVALAASVTVALAQPAPSATRGELLYNTHCIACHTKEVHWREQKLATDWPSLERQVRRWAVNSGLAWTDEDVADVTRYLNAVHYRFATPSVTGAADGLSTTPAAIKASISAST